IHGSGCTARLFSCTSRTRRSRKLAPPNGRTDSLCTKRRYRPSFDPDVARGAFLAVQGTYGLHARETCPQRGTRASGEPRSLVFFSESFLPSIADHHTEQDSKVHPGVAKWKTAYRIHFEVRAPLQAFQYLIRFGRTTKQAAGEQTFGGPRGVWKHFQ